MPLGFVMNEPGELFHEANKKKKRGRNQHCLVLFTFQGNLYELC
jgi:hypothetical protein